MKEEIILLEAGNLISQIEKEKRPANELINSFTRTHKSFGSKDRKKLTTSSDAKDIALRISSLSCRYSVQREDARGTWSKRIKASAATLLRRPMRSLRQ